MNTLHKLFLLTACASSLTAAPEATKLKHPKMRTLDAAFSGAPEAVQDLITIREVVDKLEADIAAVKDPDALVEQAKAELLEAGSKFLGLIYDLQVMVQPLMKESLLPLADDGVDPDDAFLLYRFFSVSRTEAVNYFDHAITTANDLQETLRELGKFTGDILFSLTKTTRDKYKQWKKQQNS